MQNLEFKESLAIFNSFLNEWNIELVDETEAKDWGLVGGESINEIENLAFDFRSETKSERASLQDDYRQIYES